MTQENKQKLLAELKNAIFHGDEDNVEHVDMGYEEFMMKLEELASPDSK